MSRIDEALKRASGQALGEALTDQPAARPGPNGSAADGSVLDRYVIEQGEAAAAQAPRERPRPVVASRRAEHREGSLVPDGAHRGKLVIAPEVEPASIEQYRRLATTLLELQAERGLKSLMVSSALPSEGKTLTVANLALTLSESCRRTVLLIDADFRRPSLHELFGLSNRVGLADALQSSDVPLPLVQVSPTLSVLPTGHVEESPIAMLSSDGLRGVVAGAVSRFDWVLLDTPPVGLLTDAQLVARATDGVLFVIAAGSTPYTLVQRSLAEIGTDRIVGTVLNRVEAQALPVRNYYGRYYAERR